MTSNDGDAYTKDVDRAFFKRGARLGADTFCKELVTVDCDSHFSLL